ncbi:MAG: PRC-barrel domain-containing protein [Methanomassiliicoccaceae archaeon]|nr:PRC-barrel domain-containing protein [Methanomassiliicoccaceae archaeon]
MAIRLEVLRGITMISSDAYEIGEVTDVRYDPFEWRAIGLKVNVKRSSVKLAAGHSKTNVLILPRTFVMNDVILLEEAIDEIKDLTAPDNSNMASLSSMINAKVVTKDNALVGTIITVMLDPNDWKVLSIIVRLDKTAIESMKMKKGLFSKINADISTDLILSSTEMVHLDETMDGVREKMTIVD